MTIPLIETANPVRRYSDNTVIDKITAHINPDVTLLCGPNGAGKSTLVSPLEGLVQPTEVN